LAEEHVGAHKGPKVRLGLQDRQKAMDASDIADVTEHSRLLLVFKP